MPCGGYESWKQLRAGVASVYHPAQDSFLLLAALP